MSNILQIAPGLESLHKIDYRKVHELQGSLKHMPPENLERLRTVLFGSEQTPAVGYVFPIFVWIDASGKAWTMDGHQRLKVIRSMKAKPYELPCIIIDAKDKTEAKKLLLLQNSRYGDITHEGMIEFIGDDIDIEWLKSATTLESYAMPNLEFSEGAQKGEYAQVEDDDFDLTEALEKGDDFKPENGDVFSVGNHFLICGDARSPLVYAAAVSLIGSLFDVMLTDPPYNVKYKGGTAEKLEIANDDMSEEAFFQFLGDFYNASVSAVKKGGAAYIWHSSAAIEAFVSKFKEAGFLYKQQLIWVKNQFVMGRQDYHWQHEPCIYGWRAGAAHSWHSDRTQSTVMNYDKPKRSEEHPTMKPVPLFAYQMQNSSAEGQWVLDPFGGSGTTLVAAEGCARRALLVELTTKYCNVILNRAQKIGLPVNKIKNIL